VLERFVHSAPDPRPGTARHPGLSANSATQSIGELRNPWFCTVKYPVGPSVSYRVVIDPNVLGGLYCDWAAPVPLESDVFEAAIAPAVPATITPTVRNATSSPDRRAGAFRLEVRPDGLTLAITVVLIRSSSNPLIRGLPSRSRGATSSSPAPQ
jgi:hypothetical protein